MKKLIATACFIIVSLVLATQLFAMDCNKAGRHGMRDEAKCHEGTGLYPLFAKLDLTVAQKDQIKARRETFCREIKPLKDQMFSKRGDLRLLWLETAPDKNKIMALQREVRAIRDQIQDKAVSQRLDIFSILTPEQKEKIKASLAARKARHAHSAEADGRCGGCDSALDE